MSMSSRCPGYDWLYNYCLRPYDNLWDSIHYNIPYYYCYCLFVIFYLLLL